MSTSSVSSSKPKYFVAELEFTADFPDKFKQCQAAHFTYIGSHAASNGGKIVLAGPLLDSQKEWSPAAVNGSMTIWRDATEEEVIKYTQADPFFEHGIVKNWTVRPWIPLFGHKAFEDDFAREMKN